MIGVNVDPGYDEARPDPLMLRSLGIKWIRLVSKDEQPVHDYIAQCNQYNLAVLACIARESNGYLAPGATIYQIGNEPDVDSISSWTRTPAEYHEDWRIYRETYPDPLMVTAGLASGSTEWLHQVWQIGPLSGCMGVAVHPYAKSALQARDLINSYKSIVGYNIPILISECNFAAHEIGYAVSLMQNANVIAMCHFPWTSIQNNTLQGFRENPDLLRLFVA